MKFCPECGSINYRPKKVGNKTYLICGSCNHKELQGEDDQPTSAVLTEQAKEKKRIEVIEKVEMHPKIRAKCEKCGNDVAYYWTQQTRGADEPETRFFKCTKCNYTWREYA